MPLIQTNQNFLPCSSVINEDLTFSNQTFKIKCEKVGRIFCGILSINDDLIEKFQKNTLYYVQEGKGFETHPLFDMYFLHTIDDTESKINIDDSEIEKPILVMIDVTGSSDIELVEAQLERISEWISEQKREKYNLKGIVLRWKIKQTLSVMQKLLVTRKLLHIWEG